MSTKRPMMHHPGTNPARLHFTTRTFNLEAQVHSSRIGV
jgi:hypothetical protein